MPLPNDIVLAVAEYAGSQGGYDLQEENLGSLAIEGWTDFPTRHWRYHKQTPSGQARWAEAVMLNPSSEQVARWAVDAVQHAGITDVVGAAKRTVHEISLASGFHFVVRGVHLEAMDGGDPKAYPFFDGVTVKLTAIPTYTTAPLTPEQIRGACLATEADITATGRYGRILSTTREEYSASHPGVTIGAAQWRPIVGEAYRNAWQQDANALIRAAVMARKHAWGF